MVPLIAWTLQLPLQLPQQHPVAQVACAFDDEDAAVSLHISPKRLESFA
jgi:hypothetical protein